jgi:hypothetical protein
LRTTAFLAAVLCLLAGCGDNAPTIVGSGTDAGSALDKQAIASGIMPDPAGVEFAGRYETRSEIGTDKFCAIGRGSKQFDIGFLAAYGPESKCEGQGTAVVDGEKVRVTLTGKGRCTFDAHYDGIELRFPGAVESGCASYCSPRASMSGTHYFMIQQGDTAARTTLGREIARLCD